MLKLYSQDKDCELSQQPRKPNNKVKNSDILRLNNKQDYRRVSTKTTSEEEDNENNDGPLRDAHEHDAVDGAVESEGGPSGSALFSSSSEESEESEGEGRLKQTMIHSAKPTV